ncbi:MAG: tRNA uridine-5-carboxymethylaminomethyl(34) synthesis GTPase MnmE [Rhodothermales bacterium]
MMMSAGDSVHTTIVARATPRGTSALSIVRLSGPLAVSIVDVVFPSRELAEQASHTAHVGYIGRPGAWIDHVVCTLFRAPNSATGEDIVEISCHGGDVASDAIVRLMVDGGARMAGPGEFTLRSFMNGKIDLAQAEAIGELIHAQSQRAGRISLAHLKGRYSEELTRIREDLLQLVSLLELEMDFSEEDVAFADRSRLEDLLRAASDRLTVLTGSFRFGKALHEGVRVVIVGRPNAGKSTLMNALLGHDRVIVSDVPGTTRDEVESALEYQGVRFTFVDTAGRRETDDTIEAEGVRRSQAAERGADLVLHVVDLTDMGADVEALAKVNVLSQVQAVPRLVVGNKADLAVADSAGTPDSTNGGLAATVADKAVDTRAGATPGSAFVAAPGSASGATPGSAPAIDFRISAEMMRVGDAPVEPLMDRIFAATVGSDAVCEEHQVVTSQRQQEHIRAAQQAIERVSVVLTSGGSGDMISADVRQVIEEIGAITGEVTNEDILDRIFSQFCIGK